MVKSAKLFWLIWAVLGCTRTLPPSADAGKDVVAPVGLGVTLEGAASADPQGRPLDYGWFFLSRPAGSFAELTQARAVNARFVPDVEGRYELGLVVSNGVLTSAVATVRVTAQCGVASPVVSASASPAAAAVGETVQLTGLAADADELAPCSLPSSLAYTWRFTAQPAGSAAVLSDPTSPTPRFVADVVGEYQLELSVADVTGLVGRSEVRVNAGPCGANPPRILQATAGPSGGVGQPVRLLVEAEDPDGAPGCALAGELTYAWTFEAKPAGSTASLTNATAADAFFTPDREGDYRLGVRVADATGLVERRSLSVVVSGCGAAAPVLRGLVASPAQPTTGALVSLVPDAVDPDADAPCSREQALRYAWSVVAAPAGSAARLSDAAAVRPWFVADAPGTFRFRLVVTDPSGRTTRGEVDVSVSPCGSATPVTSVQGPSAGVPGQPVQFEAVVTDADTDTACGALAPEQFTYRWWFDDLPAGSLAKLNSQSVKSPSFVPDLPGAYALAVEVTDTAGHVSAPATMTVTVSSCGANAPAVTIAPVGPANVGQRIDLRALVADVDNEPGCRGAAGPLTGPLQTFAYGWRFEAVPPGSQVALTSQTVAPSFTPDVAGQYQLRVEVTDSTGRRGLSPAALVTITPCGTSAPFVAGIAQSPPGDVPLGAGVSLSPSVTDADVAGCGQAPQFRYRWRFEELPAGSQAALVGADARVPAFSPDVAGNYVVALVVTDPTGRSSAVETVSVVASPCGASAPSASVSVDPASPMLGAPVSVTATVTDPDNGATCRPPLSGPLQTHAWAWSFDAVPPGSRAVVSNATGQVATFQPDVAGPYVLRLLATDSTGRSSAPVVQTVVVSACGGHAPVVTAFTSPLSAALGTPVRLLGQFQDADNEAACQAATFLAGARQTFSYQWRFRELPLGSTARLNDARSLTPTLVPDVRGAYVLEFVVTDSTGLESAPATVTVVGAACGDGAPTVAPSASPTPANVGSTVLLNAGALDPDAACGVAQAVTCRWWFEQLPAGSQAALNDSTSCTPSFVADRPASSLAPYVVQVVATDSTGRASQARSVRVTTNGSCGGNAPTALARATAIMSPPVVAGPGATVTLTLPEACPMVQLDARASTDPDNNPLVCSPPLNQALNHRWSLFAAPAGSGAALTPSATTATPWFVPDEAGVFTFRLRTDDGALASATPAVVNVVSPGNEVGYVIDTVGGEFSSLALHPVNGKPRVAYSVPGFSRQLRYARCERFCDTRSAEWSIFVVDTDVDFAALALGPDGTPHIAYHAPPGNGDTGSLRYATCTANCEQGTPVWSTTVVDAGGCSGTIGCECVANTTCVPAAMNCTNNGRWPSIAMNGAGQPMIGYNRRHQVQQPSSCGNAGMCGCFINGPVTTTVTESLRYAVLSGGTWQLAQVDVGAAGTATGQHTSIARGPEPTGRPRLAYYRATGGDLRYAVCTASCDTGAPTFVRATVDSADDVGLFTSVKVPADNTSRISYYDATNGRLKYAACTADCEATTATFSVGVVDNPPGIDTGRHTSLALDAAGSPRIAYYDATNADLRLARCTAGCEAAATPTWSRQTLDSTGDVGRYASLALTTTGRPLVSYFDGSNFDLKYFLTCGGP